MYQKKFNTMITIDKLNFSEVFASGKLDDHSLLPSQLEDCIRNALSIKSAQLAAGALRRIHDVVVKNASDMISPDRIINEIYFMTAIHAADNNHGTALIEELLKELPIDIDKPISRVLIGSCTPPSFCQDTLVNIAVAYLEPELLAFLLQKGANANSLSHQGETPLAQLERFLNKSASSPHPLKEKMLATMEILQEYIQTSQLSQARCV